MHCPSCGKKPSGLSYILTSNDFNLKTKMQGYLKCQHCDALLGPKKWALGIPKYHPVYYFYMVLGIVVLAVGSFYLFDFYDSQNVGSWIYFGTLGLFFAAIIVGSTALTNRYRMLEKVTPEEVTAEAKKLSAKGLLAFVAYSVAALALFWLMNEFIAMHELGLTLYLIIQNVYLFGVLIGAFLLFKNFEENGDQSLSESS